MSRRISIAIVVIALAGLLGFGAWTVLLKPSDLPPDGFARGNGRIEADLIDISPRLAGRVAEIGVHEGDLVAQEGSEELDNQSRVNPVGKAASKS